VWDDRHLGCRRPKGDGFCPHCYHKTVPHLLDINHLSIEFPVQGGQPRAAVPTKTLIAVRDLSFSIAPGEVLGLVGESGSGKSITSLAIMRLLPPQAHVCGEILFAGNPAPRNLSALDDDAMRQLRGSSIAMIFQEPMTALNPVMRVGDQIAEAVVAHNSISKSEAWRRAVDAMNEVAIPDAARRARDYPHQLSGGMRQRIMIAIALACDPKMVIADEPTTALDVTIQAQILELMKQLTHRLDVALIIITHNLGVVARYAKRVNVMYAGRIVESGPAEQIYHDPRHPYTMALLRSVPRLDRPRQARLDPVDGQPPDLTRLDAGCSFRPRCRFAVEACARSRPSLQRAGDEQHYAACFRSNEIAIETTRAPKQLEPAGGLSTS